MTIDHDFDLKKGQKIRRMNNKNPDQESCLSTRSFSIFFFENGALFHVKYLLEKKDRKCKRKFVF